MRLIDADKLKESVKYIPWCENPPVLDCIDEQETVDAEPVVHAHWVYDKWTPIHCSNCKNALRDLFRDCILMREPQYCPYCGAKMDEEENI